MAIVVTAPAALVPFALDGSVAYGPAALVAAGALAGAWTGATLMHRLRAGRLRVAFAVLVVLVPALVLLFGFDQHLAEGTSLLVVIPTALTAAYRHGREGYTDWRLGMLLGLAGVAGGLLGARAALALDSLVLQRLFGGFLLLVGARMLRG